MPFLQWDKHGKLESHRRTEDLGIETDPNVMSFHRFHPRSPSSTLSIFPEREGRLVTFKIKMDSDGFPLFLGKLLLASVFLFTCLMASDLVFYFRARSSFEAVWMSWGLSPSASPLSSFFPDFFFLALSFQRDSTAIYP